MQEVPAVPGPARLSTLVANAFADDGPLADALPAYEPRDSQRQMAAAAADIFADGGLLLAEAGPGTGKTLAYLIPAILSRHRVLISTGTKNLQDQIFYKDLPAIRDALGVSFSATYMKGRGNYLCLHRFDALRESEEPMAPVERAYLATLAEWAPQTETGDRAEVEDLPDDFPLWNDIAATSENCIGTECPRYQDCFVTKMRQRAAESDLVVVNHHLLCADAAVRQSAYGAVIPACAHAVIDEAHQLEDVATQYFGVSVSNYRLEELTRDGRRLVSAELTADEATLDETRQLLDGTQTQAHLFFASLKELGVAGERLKVTVEVLAPVAEQGRRLIRYLDDLSRGLAHLDETSEDTLALGRRAAELRDYLRFLLEVRDPEFVYFLEVRRNGVFLKASPVDVSAIVRELLLDRLDGSILTSATLTVDDSFEYVRKRLGADGGHEVRLASEFDFREQAVLYLPRRMPDPRTANFPAAVAHELLRIFHVTKGRAFALFTSYANLREVKALLEPKLDYPLLVQGSTPRSVLLREFQMTPNAVLLATSSFWQGVDVAGDALSCVVIDKLPFVPPGDPITAARIEAIEASGGNGFVDYQVPLAILTLQQGFGRLIRHRSDRGILVLLDPRVQTMAYGRRFLASLPPAPLTHDLADVERFFSRHSSEQGVK